MNNYITPVNVIKAAGITPEQYAHMTQREVFDLVRLVYSIQLQTNQEHDNDK